MVQRCIYYSGTFTGNMCGAGCNQTGGDEVRGGRVDCGKDIGRRRRSLGGAKLINATRDNK